MPGRHLYLVIALSLCLILIAGCQDPQVKGEYSNPYSLHEVKTMMGYHGAQVARFDGEHWWFLSGRQWIRIEAGGAREFAMLARGKNGESY